MLFNQELCFDLPVGTQLNGELQCGLCWDEYTRRRMADPKALEQYGYKVYSQNDEDGIIHEVFRRIGTKNKLFVEFGVQNGLESNCHLLLHYGWKGLWIEGSKEYCKDLKMRFRPVISEGKLVIDNEFITKENINEIIEKNGFSGEIDLLSVDIDGNDYYVWKAIDVINPRVVITEYNGKFPPDLEWCQAYNPNHMWDGSDWHGASLKSYELLGREKGYRLVGTNLRGCNAFFVRVDLCKDLFLGNGFAEELYNPLRMGLSFVSNHPSKYCLVDQKENLGVLNYRDYNLVEGFHDIEHNESGDFVWTSSKEAVLQLRVPRNTKMISIPYRVPQEVIDEIDDYSIIVSGDRVDITNTVSKCEGTIDICLGETTEDEEIVDLSINIPRLWIPSKNGISQDSRELGIMIDVSGIRICGLR